jgi:hypothetical protein
VNSKFKSYNLQKTNPLKNKGRLEDNIEIHVSEIGAD